MPCRAPCTMALASAWVERRQCPLTMGSPTSVQCATWRGAPLYPVVRMRWSRTSTAPTLARGQVARVATVRAISMKYSSQPGRISGTVRGASSHAPRGLTRTENGTELVLPNIRSPASPSPGTMYPCSFKPRHRPRPSRRSPSGKAANTSARCLRVPSMALTTRHGPRARARRAKAGARRRPECPVANIGSSTNTGTVPRGRRGGWRSTGPRPSVGRVAKETQVRDHRAAPPRSGSPARGPDRRAGSARRRPPGSRPWAVPSAGLDRRLEPFLNGG